VSWAIDLANGSTTNAAVTFPWMIGFNPRQVPRLATNFKVFPHVSMIVPISSQSATPAGPMPRIALGGGIAVATVFTFSVGVTVNESTAHSYLLAGLSVTDIAKLAAQP
jgi:hypothetical protein